SPARSRGSATSCARLDADFAPRQTLRAVAASYFDVDGTLVKTNLIHPTLYYLVHQRTPLRSMQKLARAVWKSPQMVLAELQDRRMFNEVLFTAYEGMSGDRLHILADEAFDAVL